MKVYVSYLGCRVNQAEIEGMASSFKAKGMEVVDSPQEADIMIINTCAVTKEAERKSRQHIRRLRRINPAAKLIAVGCYVELVGDEVLKLGADQALKNREKSRLLDSGASPFLSICGGLSYHSRPFVKVQDGCDANCSYCLIRLLRGKGVSRPIDEVVSEVKRLISLGYDEITVVGVHLGSYGKDIGTGLKELLEALLKLRGLRLLRLGSVEPFDIDEGFIHLYERFDNLAPHLHLPLQSGSDRVLRLMRRPYLTRDYIELVERLRAVRSDFNVTTDIMVGFPTETDEDFRKTLEVIDRVNFGRIHAFRYSPRPFTDAAKMPSLPSHVVDERLNLLIHKAKESALRFNEGLVGKTFDVLVLEDGSALLPNYVEVFLFDPPPRRGWISVRVERATPQGVYGRVLNPS